MHPRPLSIWFIALALALAFVTACMESPAPLPEETTTSETTQALTYCNDTCDCPHGSYCVNNQCQVDFGPHAPCYCASRDCPSGYNTCAGGFCSSTCSSNCDCPFGSYCSGGACQPDFGPFAHCYCASRDCAAGQACTNGFCTGGGGGGGGGGGYEDQL